MSQFCPILPVQLTPVLGIKCKILTEGLSNQGRKTLRNFKQGQADLHSHGFLCRYMNDVTQEGTFFF